MLEKALQQNDIKSFEKASTLNLELSQIRGLLIDVSEIIVDRVMQKLKKTDEFISQKEAKRRYKRNFRRWDEMGLLHPIKRGKAKNSPIEYEVLELEILDKSGI